MVDVNTQDVENLSGLQNRYEEYRKEGRVAFITFHPSYSYEEFVEGITVKLDDESKTTPSLTYEMKIGIFKEICTRALASACGLPVNDYAKRWEDVFNIYIENRGKISFEDSQKFILIIDDTAVRLRTE